MATVEELEKKADDLKIDRSSIKGTGTDGNVLKADLEKAIADAEKAKNAEEKPAPSQPWVKQAAAAEKAAPAADSEDTLPAEAHDQLTPTGDPDEAHEKARDEAAGGNGGGAENVPAELVDQHTPTGPSPEQVDERAEAGTPDSSTNRIDAEAKDQETPHGEDLSLAIHEQLEALTEDERVEFEDFMRGQATAKLEQLTKGREARSMEARLVDGNAHYGTRRALKQRNKAVEK